MPGKRDRKGIESHEGSLTLGEVFLVFPKHPNPCDYVRIVNRHDLIEIAYWISDEWRDEPDEVMGAIIGSMCQGVRGTLR